MSDEDFSWFRSKIEPQPDRSTPRMTPRFSHVAGACWAVLGLAIVWVLLGLVDPAQDIGMPMEAMVFFFVLGIGLDVRLLMEPRVDLALDAFSHVIRLFTGYCALLIAGILALTSVNAPVGVASLHQTSTSTPEQVNQARLTATLASTPSGEYPFYTNPDGTWELSGPRRWVSGFLPGSLWYEYERTGDESWKLAARERELPLAAYANDTSTHDLGFMLQCSYGNDYRLTGGAQAKNVLLQAARSLASRYDARVGMVRTLNTPDDFYVYNDTMINIGLLFWGASHGGDPAWRTMAESHAHHTIKDFLRSDGSSYHYVSYDETTGAILRKGQGQGAFDESTWSRGQAWIIYGLSAAYRETGDTEFLVGARKAADYWVANVPADMVPYWDFDAPDIPDTPRDSSAAAVAASAFTELAELDPDADRRKSWSSLAGSTIASLSSSAYLAEGGVATLAHGTYAAMSGQSDQGTSWGDYYFSEALARTRAQVDRLTIRPMVNAPSREDDAKPWQQQ